MKAIDPNELEERDNYNFLTGSIIPRPVALVTTLSNEHVLNAAPFSYFNIISANPPMISVSVQRSKGVLKDTSRNAILHREFVIHVADESYLEHLNMTAKNIPSDKSEVEEANLTPISSLKIKVPGIQEAKVRMECVLERFIPLGGTKESPACDLLIGRVVQYHINEELYQNRRIDAEALNPISRLGGNFYSKLGEMIELERPK